MRARSIRTLSLGALVALGASAAFAAAQPPAGQPPRAGQKVTQGDTLRARHGGRHAGRHPAARLGRAVFRGITLTDAQKAQVKTIHQKYAQQRRQIAQDARAKWQGARPAAGQRPDSATRAAMRQQREALGVQLRPLMDREVADLRGVLTTEQQATFDRNVADLKARAADARTGRGERGQGRGLRGGRRPAPEAGSR